MLLTLFYFYYTYRKSFFIELDDTCIDVLEMKKILNFIYFVHELKAYYKISIAQYSICIWLF